MKNNKGVTFIELMIGFGITALVCGSLYIFFSDSMRQTNIITARDYIKQESNKIFKILENDLSQAKANSLKLSKNEFSIKVHLKDEEKHGMKDLYGASKIANPVLRYTFNKPKLHRYFEGKCWLVSNCVDSLEITEPSEAEKETTPGKLVVKLVMKSNLVGIKASDQPVYEQNKVVIIREEAASRNDPNWFGVGKLYDNFSTGGDLLASLKSDSAQLWTNNENNTDYLKEMSIAQLEQHLINLNNSNKELKDNLNTLDKEIAGMDRRAFYDGVDFPGFTVFKKTETIKQTLCGFKTKEQMDKASYSSFIKEVMVYNTNFTFVDTISGLWEGKHDILNAIDEIDSQINAAKEQLKETKK